jgi:hypothetical protein
VPREIQIPEEGTDEVVGERQEEGLGSGRAGRASEGGCGCEEAEVRGFPLSAPVEGRGGMIEIVCSNGDRANAPCEASAVLAARTLREDHWLAMPCQGRGRDLTFSFFVVGQHSVTVTSKELDRQGR